MRAPLAACANNFRSLPAASIERHWNNGSNISAAGVELATFFENLDQMEPARIPNDCEHAFFRLNSVWFSFGNFFIPW
jgi:hypothetical protein